MSNKNKSKVLSIKQEIQFTDIINLCLSNLVWLCLVGIISAGITGLFVKFCITPQYESYVTMYVHNATVNSTSNSSINNNDLLAAESLAGTYKIILQSNVVLDAVIKEVNSGKELYFDLSRDDVSDMLTVSTVENTQLIKISIKSTNAILAYDIANAFADVSEEEIIRVTKAGGVEVVDNAELSYAQVSPKIVIDCILGFIVGAVIAVVYFIIRMISDTTVYHTDDVYNITDVPIFGVIPNIKENEEELGEWKTVCTRIMSYDGGYKDADNKKETSR
ncbi:MAG: Wzz/FepE/Etk N-terminal domain-containing protein [Acutalibacteraceae bacterium]|nr:Wzz/FepE/Etk N-terminal domain-containing protein [Acutalibacteraceae bacterium]